MKFMTIASGSSGNASLILGSSAAILCDCGISAKRIERALDEADVPPTSLAGICLTHEHSDHISGLGVISKRYKLPIYATEGTLRGIRTDKPGAAIPELFHVIHPGQDFQIGDITVSAMEIPHDANQPVAFTFSENGKKIGLATDLGHRARGLEEFLQDVNILLLEANHDVRMVEAGPYPYYLKQRILGKFGHLSNIDAGILLNQLLHPALRYVFLGHLSKNNNYPPLCFESVRAEIAGNPLGITAEDIHLTVAPHDGPGPMVEI